MNWVLNLNRNKSTKQKSLKTIFILKSLFTLAAIVINHEHQKYFLLKSSALMSCTVQSWASHSWTMFPVKCQVQDSKFGTELHSSSVSLPDSLLHLHTFSLPFSPWRFSSSCWTDELNKKTLKHIRREICVDSGWLFLWYWLYFDKEIVPDVLMCSCAALYW